MSVPENRMVIAAALLFDRRVERAQVEDLVRGILARERFRERVVEPRFGVGIPRWAEVHRLDVTDHLELLSSPASLVDVVSSRLAVPFPEDRPPWSAHLVPQADGTSALVLLVHHCVADGGRLVALFEEIAGAERKPSVPSPQRPRRARLPSKLLAGALGAARLVLRPREPLTPLRARLGGKKRLAFSGAIPLSLVTDAAHALGVTVNDLLLAAVAGALRRELERATGGPPDPRLTLHALIPVSVHAPGTPRAGNRYTSMFVPLPVGVADPAARARAIDHDVHELRAHGAIAAGMRMIGAAGIVTAGVERVGVAILSRRATVMVSNVRGPEAPLHLAGATVSDVLAWAPSPGSIGVGVSLFTYAGRARIGICIDSRIPADAARVAAAVESELLAFAPSSAITDRG